MLGFSPVMTDVFPMPPLPRVLLADDDEALRRSVVEQLQFSEELDTVEAATAAAALAALRVAGVAAAVVGAALSDLDGVSLCRRLRDEGMEGPIILLTRPGAEDEAVAGLEAGASETLARPFRLGTLLVRLRAQLRQHAGDAAVIPIGPYRFRPGAKLLEGGDDGRRVRLTEKESAILHYLYRAGAKVTGRDELLGEVWGYSAGVSTHTLETHVYRLRQKIESDPAHAAILVTEPGGYRLVP